MMEITTARGLFLGKDECRTAKVCISNGEIRVLNVGRSGQIDLIDEEFGNESITVASVPWADVLTRCWTFPGVEREQLLSLVNHQLEAEMPIAVEELTWGFRHTRTTVSGKTGWNVFVQAVRTKRVNQCREILKSGKTNGQILTTPAQAIGAFYRFGLKEGTNKKNDILILATTQEWQIIFLADGVVRNVRRVRGAGESIESLITQCKNVIEGEKAACPAERVLWCADGSMKEAANHVDEVVGCDVIGVESQLRLTDLQGQPWAEPELASYAVAVGSAMAGLFDRDDLIKLAGEIASTEPPGLTRLKKVLSHTRRWSALAAGLTILAMTIHLYGLSRENAIMEDLIDRSDKTEVTVKSLESKIESAKRLRMYRIDVEGILVDISRAVPNTIVISSIQLSREHRLTISGTTKDPKAIFTFVDTLRKSKRLANINPENIEQNKGSFTLIAEMAGVKKLNERGTRGESWN
jgi:Tfp pilus assembly PilM family ATPase